MPSELIISVVIAASLIGIVLFFALARKAIRLAIRLMLAFIVMLLVIVGSLAWWWFGNNSSTSTPQNRPANSRRGNSR